MFSQLDNAPSGGSNVAGPAFEFNWGFLPNLMIHVVTPFENAIAPGMSNAFGFGDMELGIKFRFVPESAGRPQIGIFPMAEIATGDAGRNLGSGQTWYRLPLWIQKSYDGEKWTIDADGSVAVNHAPAQRDYGFGGVLVQRSLGPLFTLGAEMFTQGLQAAWSDPRRSVGATYLVAALNQATMSYGLPVS